MLPLLIGAGIGLFQAIFFMVMAFLIIYFYNKGSKKESFSETYPITTTNLPQKFHCHGNDYGTLRCVTA
jgi:hypothetical protein